MEDKYHQPGMDFALNKEYGAEGKVDMEFKTGLNKAWNKIMISLCAQHKFTIDDDNHLREAMKTSATKKYQSAVLKDFLTQVGCIDLYEPLIKEAEAYKTTGNGQNLKFEVMQLLLKKKRNKASEMIVQSILKESRIYTIRSDDIEEMWIYSIGIYIPQAKTYIKEFVREVIGDAFTKSFCNLVIEKIAVDTYIDAKIFFQNEIVGEIPVENGILNLTTRELTEFTPDKLFFNKLPMKYDKDAKCPTIEKHFKAVLKHEDDIPVMFELFGYLLWKDYFIEKAVMMTGGGRNGKGKTVSLMKLFIGVENCASVPIQQLESDLYALGEMFKKMANLSADISPTALKNTGYFKNLTARDYVTAPRKYLGRVGFVSYAKQVFCANTLPITYDNTEAFWNRWVLLEFPFKFLSQKEIDVLGENERENIKLQDPVIIEKLSTTEELQGLLIKALEGLDRLHKQGDFSYSNSVEQVKNMWIRKSDSFTAFLMDCVEEDWDSCVIKMKLSRAYVGYCRNHKVPTVGTKAIKSVLAMRGIGEDRKSIDGKQEAVWQGIRLRGDTETKEEEVTVETVRDDKEAIIRFLRDLDKGEGVTRFELINALKLDAVAFDSLIEYCTTCGDIFSPKPDVFKEVKK